MSETLKSFLILLGGLALVLAMWYLSVRAVRYDTRRRLARGEIHAAERSAWIAVAATLPLFGFALYLFQRILQRYLTPEPEQPVGAMVYRAGGDTYPVHTAAPGVIAQTGSGGDVAGGTVRDGAAARPISDTQPGAAYRTPVGRPRYALTAMEGPYTGQSFPLLDLPVRIGRGPGAALSLDQDLNVSRSHAEIYLSNGALHVHDLGSTHGTLINGRPISDQILAPGDHLALGGTVLMLREFA